MWRKQYQWIHKIGRKIERDPVSCSIWAHLGYLAVDLALNVDLDGQMCNHVCNRQFAILICLFDRCHIPRVLAFDIPFVAMVDFPTLIRVLLLFQLPTYNPDQRHYIMSAWRVPEMHAKLFKWAKRFGFFLQQHAANAIPFTLSPLTSYADGPGPVVSNRAMCLCFWPKLNDDAVGFDEMTIFLYPNYYTIHISNRMYIMWNGQNKPWA